MKNVLLWELKRRRNALLWWCIGSAIISAVIMLLYPSIRDQAQQLNQVINQLPPGLRGLKTGNAGTINVGEPMAFMNSQLFYATLPILWIILAITRGASIVGRDEQSHTLELLLARPISRGRLITAKAVSLILELVIVGTVTLAVILIVAPLCGIHIGSLRLGLATVYTALFSLSFGLIAFALQALSTLTHRAAAAIAVIASFGGYLLASLSGLTDWLKTPAKYVPYHYFNPEAVLKGDAVTGLNVYLIGVFVLTAVVAYVGFRHRDIS